MYHIFVILSRRMYSIWYLSLEINRTGGYNLAMAEHVKERDRAREWYISNPLATLKDVSAAFEIAYETVRDWSRDEGWSSQRTMKGKGDDEQIVLQAAGMRDVLYEEIMSGDLSPGEKADLVKTWLALRDIKKPPEREDTVDRNAILGDL